MAISSAYESKFVHAVLEELDAFQQKPDENSILLFPPLHSRFRYIVHRTVLDHPNLSTFSVGEDKSRRVIVCWCSMKLEVVEDKESGQKNSTYSQGNGTNTTRRGMKTKREQIARLPDKPVYIPPAMRHNALDPEQSLKHSKYVSTKEKTSPDVEQKPPVANQEPELISPEQTLEDPEIAVIPNSGPSLCPAALDTTVSGLQSLSVADDEADQNYSSNVDAPSSQRERIDEDFLSQIKCHLKQDDFSIINLSHKFSSFTKNSFDPEEFSHVVEIYEFPATFKTKDLLHAFNGFRDGGMKIKWVDDSHALGVFSSRSAATHALSLKHPELRVRSLSDASQKSKSKVIHQAEFLQPVKDRPQADVAVARRMVTHALGFRGDS